MVSKVGIPTQERGNEVKMLVPKLRFPEFLDAESWEKHTLEESLKESRIIGNKGDVAKKITVKLWGKGVYEKNDAIKGSVNTQYFRRSAGQFIYSKLDFLNQAFGIIPPNLDNYESTVDLPCFDVNESINTTFLLEYVQRKEFFERLGEIADGSRKAKRIHVDTFLTFPIFRPSIAEQQKIADCLSSIDELITAHTQKHEALKAHKKGLMQQLFPSEGETVPKLRFPEFRDAGEWNISTIEEIGFISSGGTPSRTKNEYWNGSIPWVTTTLINFNIISRANETITETGLKNSSTKILPKSTILMAMYGQGKTRGKVAILGVDAAINQACAAIILKNGIDTGFVFQNLASRYDEIRRISNQGGQENLSGALIKKIPFSYPDIKTNEQQKIANCLSSIDNLITTQAQKIESLKAHKKGLMQQLFPNADKANG